MRVLRAVTGRLFGGYILAFHDLPGERFRDLIDALAPDEPVHLSELIDRLRRGQPTRGIFAITVDDGVGDTVRALSTVCKDRHWPITFFLPTRYLDAAGGLPFQWLKLILARLPRGPLGLRAGVVDLSTDAARRTFERRLWGRVYTRPVAEYAGVIDELMEHALAHGWLSRERDAPPAAISWEEVAALAAHPAIRFESHGVTHTAAAALQPDQLEWELRESRERIRAHTGTACRHFAYPFGSPESIGAAASSVVARYYDAAVTMSRGRVSRRDLARLPRIPLYAQDSPGRARLKLLTF